MPGHIPGLPACSNYLPMPFLGDLEVPQVPTSPRGNLGGKASKARLAGGQASCVVVGSKGHGTSDLGVRGAARAGKGAVGQPYNWEARGRVHPCWAFLPGSAGQAQPPLLPLFYFLQEVMKGSVGQRGAACVESTAEKWGSSPRRTCCAAPQAQVPL